jgi:hypothetical protein
MEAAKDFAAGAARRFLGAAARALAAFARLLPFGNTKRGSVALGTTKVDMISSFSAGSRSAR